LIKKFIEELVKLKENISDNYDVVLYDEAVNCFKNGAYRMAYIAGWLCAAESLKNKIKIMSERDDVAEKVFIEIEKLENAGKPADQFILQNAKNIGLVDNVSFSKLEPFIKHRNIFAHPYNQTPRPDEVFGLLKTIIEEVLSNPAYLRRPFIDQLLKNITEIPHFLIYNMDKIHIYCDSITNKIIPSQYPYLFIQAVYLLNNIRQDPDKAVVYKKTKIFLRRFLLNVNSDFKDEKWKVDKKFQDFPSTITDLFLYSPLFTLISEDMQDKIISYVTDTEITNNKMVNYVKLLMKFVATPDCLTEPQKNIVEQCLSNFINNENYYVLLGEVPFSLYSERIIGALKSHDWYVQNPAARALANIKNVELQQLPPDMLEILGRNILQSAEGGANGSGEFISQKIYSEELLPEPFIKGLLFECFINEARQFRCKKDFLKLVLNIVFNKNPANPKTLIEELVAEIKRATPKYPMFSSKTNEALVILEGFADELRITDTTKEALVRLLISEVNNFITANPDAF